MTFVPAPGVIRLVAGYAIGAEALSNTVYVQDEDSPSAVRVGQAATALSLSIQANIMPVLSSECLLVRVQAYDLASETAPVATVVIDPGVPGGAASATSATVVAARVKFLTGQRGRSFRGRIFQGGVPEGDIGGTSLDSGVATALRDGWVQVKDDLDAEFSHCRYFLLRPEAPHVRPDSRPK